MFPIFMAAWKSGWQEVGAVGTSYTEGSARRSRDPVGPKTTGQSPAKLEVEALTLALVAHTFVTVQRRTICFG